jgi:hypothetical protein
MGTLIDRVHRELNDDDIAKIADTYHRWRGDDASKYADVAGFCKSATTEEIRAHQHVLTPGRYVGSEEVEDDGEPFEEKMARLRDFKGSEALYAYQVGWIWRRGLPSRLVRSRKYETRFSLASSPASSPLPPQRLVRDRHAAIAAAALQRVDRLCRRERRSWHRFD